MVEGESAVGQRSECAADTTAPSVPRRWLDNDRGTVAKESNVATLSRSIPSGGPTAMFVAIHRIVDVIGATTTFVNTALASVHVTISTGRRLPFGVSIIQMSP